LRYSARFPWRLPPLCSPLAMTETEVGQRREPFIVLAFRTYAGRWGRASLAGYRTLSDATFLALSPNLADSCRTTLTSRRMSRVCDHDREPMPRKARDVQYGAMMFGPEGSSREDNPTIEEKDEPWSGMARTSFNSPLEARFTDR
jgi:hypothetical protein